MKAQQNRILVTSILVAFVAFLDGSVVNVALPAISRELGGGLAIQQWVVDAYLITLGSLILVAGSASDLFGRKRAMQLGLLGFGLASLLCAIAPNGDFLIAARAFQGAAGALLVPSSLALIIASFSGEAQGKAIGTWTAWTGIAFVIGPLVGGFLVDTASWRWVFGINLLPILVTLWLVGSLATDKGKEGARIDWLGAVLCALGLGGLVSGLIQAPLSGWASPWVAVLMLGGVAMLAAFGWHERRTAKPMLPLRLFAAPNFSAGNGATAAIYAGLGAATFLITIFVQQVGHYSAKGAGLAVLPVTIIMFMLSPRFGALSGRFGPRLFMAVGPLVAACGFLAMRSVDGSVAYWTQLFPGILLFGVGLSVTVAPLTAAVLGSVESGQAGIASAVNNAVARIAGLLATAALGTVVGTQLDVASFKNGLLLIAASLAVGGLISAAWIRNPQKPA